MSSSTRRMDPWRVSLHGGHSGSYCDHATGTLREILEAAVVEGYATFGVSEHVPRPTEFLYPEEIALGWNADLLKSKFDDYTMDIQSLQVEFKDKLNILKGFEAEVVPTSTYESEMLSIRSKTLQDGSQAFDYFVGSVHYVDGMQIDGSVSAFKEAVDVCGGLETLAEHYYVTIAQMVLSLKPEIVGHFDLIKKNAIKSRQDRAVYESKRVIDAAVNALEAVKSTGAVLDLNTAGWRKGLGEPYPAPWVVDMAKEMEIPFCFGDDSHNSAQVGHGINDARLYLIENGVDYICTYDRTYSGLEKRIIGLK